MEFKDVMYMTAKEKEVVLKNFEGFLKSCFKESKFTYKLYEYLHVECGFIAHYNKTGFYNTYFTSPDGIERFFKKLFIYNDIIEDYLDLHEEMRKVYFVYKESIEEAIKDEISIRFEYIILEVEKGKKDFEYAKKVVEKYFG